MSMPSGTRAVFEEDEDFREMVEDQSIELVITDGISETGTEE
jgi:hypothetical protein